MRNIYTLVILCFMVGSNHRASGQTLQVLLAAADSANLELKALHQEYLAALQKAPQVSQLPEPQAGLGIFVLPPETRLGPQWVRLSASQLFPWSGTLPARKEHSLAIAKARYEKIAASRLFIHYQLKQAYFQLYELQQQQRITETSIRLFKSLESAATTAVENGNASLADVLQVQIRIRNLEERLNILSVQEQKPLALLNQLLNRPANLPISVLDSFTLATPPYDRVQLLQSIQQEHPLLRMYTLQQEVARKAIQVNTLESRPSFQAGLDYFAVAKRTDANPSKNGRDILTPRVGVRLPIYRDKYRAKEQEEKLIIQALETRKQEQLLRFRTDLEAAFTDLESNILRYNLYTEQKSTTQSAINILLAEYSTAGARFSDLIQLEDQLVQYDIKMLEALVNTQLAKAAIERYIP